MTSGVPHVPTEDQRNTVSAMAAYGIPQKEICSVIGISWETLLKHYRTELDTASAKANSKIAQRLYQKALDGDTASMIFWLKTRARWAETVKQEISGADGGPVQHDVRTVTIEAEAAKHIPSDILDKLIADAGDNPA